MSRRTLLPVLAVAAAALLAVAVHHARAPRRFHRFGAFHGARPWGGADAAGRAERLTARLGRRLDLSAGQRAKALPLVRALLDARADGPAAGAPVLEALRDQFSAGRFDPRAVEAAFRRRDAQRAASREAWLKALAGFHASLNPEQRAKAAEALGRMRARLEADRPPKERR